MAENENKLNINIDGNNAIIKVFGILGTPSYFQDYNPEENAATKEEMRREIEAINSIPGEVTKITLKIGSPGGDPAHAFAMYRALDVLPAEKFTEYEEDSGSAATILGSISPLKNISIPEYLTLVIHEARANNINNATTEFLDKLSDELRILNNNIAKVYSRVNGKSIEDNLAIMAENKGEGKLYSAEQAKKDGFVGNVIPLSGNIAACNYDTLKSWSGKQIELRKKAEKSYLEARKNKTVNTSKSNINKQSKPMDFTDIFTKKKPFTIAQGENRLILTALKKGEPVSIDGSEDLYSGPVEHDNKVATVENGKIVAVKEISTSEREIVALKAQNKEFKTNLENITNQVVSKIGEMENKLVAKIDALKEENLELKATAEANAKVIKEARLAVSSPKLPVAEMSTEEIADEYTPDADAQMYAEQKRMAEERRVKKNKEVTL